MLCCQAPAPSRPACSSALTSPLALCCHLLVQSLQTWPSSGCCDSRVPHRTCCSRLCLFALQLGPTPQHAVVCLCACVCTNGSRIRLLRLFGHFMLAYSECSSGPNRPFDRTVRASATSKQDCVLDVMCCDAVRDAVRDAALSCVPGTRPPGQSVRCCPSQRAARPCLARPPSHGLPP